MTDPNTTSQPADGAAYMELQDALSEVISFPGTEIVPGYATVNVKKEIHDNDGNAIPAQLHFMNQSGELYFMSIEGKTETGLKGQLIRYNATTGGAFTLSNLIDLILADETLAPLIDQGVIEKAYNQQLPGQTTLFKDETPAKSPRDIAIEKGALMTIGGHVASYSTNDLKNALNAYSIMRLPNGTDATTVFDENGKLNMLMVQPKTLESLLEIDSAFLMAIVQSVSLSAETGDDTVTVYAPTLCRDLGIDPREYSTKRNGKADLPELRLNALLNRIIPFDPYVALAPDGSYYRVCSFDKYEKDSETITLRAPYFFKLKRIVEARANELKHPQFNRLFRGNIATEPNSAAVELANRILQGIVTRGARADYRTYKADPQKIMQTVTTTDASGKRKTTKTTYKEEPTEAEPKEKKVTWKAKFSTLIDDCPQAALQLQGTKTVQAYNSKLKQLFEAAYRIIAEKSDAPSRYIDFTLPTTQRTVKGKKQKCYDVPTKSTLNRYMKITHRGINPDFRA